MAIPISASCSIAQLFEQQTLITPQNIAIIDHHKKLTYQQLNEQSNQLAHWLRQQGILKNDFVALLLDPDVEFIISVLAIIKSGAAYLPLDNLSPSSRLKEILYDASPRLLITSRKYHSSLEVNQWQTESVEELLEKSNHFSSSNLTLLQSPEDPVYMLYTSGSTGKPKGVVIPHCAVINLVNRVNYFEIKQKDIVAQVNNLAFDASVLEIWSALLNGGTLFFVPLEVRKNYCLLKATLLENQVRHLMLPTGYFHQLALFSPDTLDSISLLVFGGESVNPSIIGNFLNMRRKQNLPITLINAYGPSETTVAACRYVIDEKNLNDLELLSSIGKPINNVKTYILNDELQLVNPGEVGELYISGINLALGYYNNKNADNEKFIKNHFDQQYPFQRLYKTGDLVKQLPNGNLLYISRNDDKVKIQGFRVHLGEIERQLILHPSIKVAAVITERDASDRTRLIAYVVLSEEKTKVTRDEIKKYLSLHLPPYMIPPRYIQIDALPLSSIGKIDKKLLSEIEGTEIPIENVISPANSIEKKLKIIFSQLLNTNHIDVAKNFFDLGLNSLLLMELCVKISEEFQLNCRPEIILAYPTIRKLGQHLRQKTVAFQEA